VNYMGYLRLFTGAWIGTGWQPVVTVPPRHFEFRRLSAHSTTVHQVWPCSALLCRIVGLCCCAWIFLFFCNVKYCASSELF